MPFSLDLRRQMSCTRAEFMSWLPGAIRMSPFHVDGNSVTISTAGGTVEITLEEREPRRAGLMSLPRLDVAFRFSGLDDAAREDFLAYFDLYTRRGGG
jgi:hypothetical protein